MLIRAAVFILILLPNLAYALPAFPGAEGMGADTVGGRNGTVYIVDTLSDNPLEGLTFREAVTASGPRYVVFAVSGIIDLTSDLIIDNPYITIAGETSPGGILIAGRMTFVATHDVLVRHMRFRLGAHRYTTAADAETNGDALAIIGSQSTTVTAYNILFDHCSFSWGIDETVSVNYNAQDVTFSWCFITSGLMNSIHPDSNWHSAGFIAWGKYSDPEIRVSLHHCFMGYNYFRVPENNYNSFLDSVNNVAYYWYASYSHEVGSFAGYHSKANIIGNYRKIHSGISSPHTFSAMVVDYPNNIQESIYMTGNLDGTRDDHDDPQWSAGEFWMNSLLSTDWQRSTPFPTSGFSGTGIPVTATTMSSAYASTIVATAGATKPFRDSVDSEAAANYEAGTGFFTNADDVDTLQEFPTFTTPEVPTDSDSDGMSDAWELSVFGSLSETATGDNDLDGYENIEEYFHYLAGSQSEPDNPSPNNGGGSNGSGSSGGGCFVDILLF